MSAASQPGKVAPKFGRKKRSLGYHLTKTYENEIKCYFTGILFQQNFTESFYSPLVHCIILGFLLQILASYPFVDRGGSLFEVQMMTD